MRGHILGFGSVIELTDHVPSTGTCHRTLVKVGTRGRFGTDEEALAQEGSHNRVTSPWGLAGSLPQFRRVGVHWSAFSLMLPHYRHFVAGSEGMSMS